MFAIKHIRNDGNKQTYELFMIESSIAKRLSHPNIARVYETWEDDNNLFLVMELCEGGELLQYIANKQKKFEEDEVATIINQCIYALAYLHENNICHRDVKPENFLLQSTKKGPLVIGGALSKFESDPSFVYVPMFKIAGPKSEVAEWLEENHPDEMKTARRGSYSRATLKTSSIRAAFDKEVEEASKHRQDFTQYRNEMKQVDLRVLVNILQMYDRMRKADPESVTVSQKSTSKTMKDRLREIVQFHTSYHQ